MIRTRFAPSPTGRLHVGNARVALLNWLYAKQHEGVFILRLDDTDVDRSEEIFAAGIKEDLTWLGLSWQGFARQSDRTSTYQETFQRLHAMGRLYPCYESQEELDLKRKILISQKKAPMYDRAALKLTDAEKNAYRDKGIEPHWRFLIQHEPITWHDMLRGETRFQGTNISDPVLFRANGRPIYSLASVVDDIDMGITHVIRGEDHITNTAAQVQITMALGDIVPMYCHLPLLSGTDGGALSKRLGSLSLQNLRDDGIEPMAINSQLARLGSPNPIEAVSSLEGLLADFDLSRYSRATPRFDDKELHHLNAILLQNLSFEAVCSRLKMSMDETFWLAVRPNITRLQDLQDWWRICREKIQPVVDDDAAYADMAAALLPPLPWSVTTWQTWVNHLKEKTGRQGKELFMPLRRRLTGQEHGPELAVLLPLIGRNEVLDRLKLR
jgi:glutamyl-tRNA synthetase